MRLRPVKDLVIAFALIGVGDGEVRDGPVEFVALAEVSADLFRLAAAGVRAGKDPSAQLGVLHHRRAIEDLDEHLDLHVFELPDV